MNAPLYTIEILRLAAATAESRTLSRIDGTAVERSSTCGSVVKVDVELGADGRIVDLTYQVQACAFGQAAATLMAASAIGRGRDEVSRGLDELAEWLAGSRGDPGSWPGLAALAPARSRSSRHQAILLPFRALLRALGDGQ